MKLQLNPMTYPLYMAQPPASMKVLGLAPRLWLLRPGVPTAAALAQRGWCGGAGTGKWVPSHGGPWQFLFMVMLWDFMVILWWFYGDLYNGDLMVI